MSAYQRKPTKFWSRGMNLNVPPDDIPEHEYAYILNMRAYEDGRFETRPGLVLVSEFPPATSGDYIHSFYTLNDTNPDSAGGSRRFFGFNDTLWWSDITFPATPTVIGSGFSGNPLSLIGMSPIDNPTPFLYVYDSSAAPIKVSASYLLAGIPVSFPVGVPQSAVYAALAPVPTILAGGNITGSGYFWRFQLRHALTGARSIPGVPTRTAISLSNEKVSFPDPAITITGNLALDQEYTWDLYRFTAGSWKLVGSITNRSGNTLTDNFADIDLAAAPSLDVTPEGILYQPWLTTDIPRSGVTTSTAPAVATSSGVTGGIGSRISTATGFNIQWIPGTEIFIAGVACTIQAVISPQTLFVDQDLGPNLGAVSWSTPEGTLKSGASLPYVWGPYGSGQGGLFLFACGDPRDPGKIYWTNGNDPDSVSLRNNLDITGPAEAMQNGCIWNARSWGWSTERMFEIVPDLAAPGNFIAQVVPGARGLPLNWCFASGDVIYFKSKDGIFKFGGGGLPESISDHQLYELLGHDGQNGFGTTLFNPDFPGSPIRIQPPEPTKVSQQRLFFGNGVLYFDYVDTDNIPTTLLYDTHKRDYTNASPAAPGWSLDRYNPGGYSAHYIELGFNTVFVASGRRFFFFSGDTEDGLPINFALMTGADLLGDLRAIKLIGDAVVGAAPNNATVTARLLADRNSRILVSGTLLTGGAYQQTILTVNDAVRTEPEVESQTIGLWLSGASTARCLVTDWEPSWVMKPELSAKRATDWDNDGEPGDKYLYGCLIMADTFGLDRTVDVLGDGDHVIATLAINHAIQSTKPYAFEVPYVTHQVRLRPTDANLWELFQVWWKWTPWPEFTEFLLDYTDDGYPGAKFFQGFILQASTAQQPESAGAEVTFTVLYDGGQIGGVFTKVRHDGNLEIAYSFPAPFIAHQVRVASSGPIRFQGPWKITWVWEPAPELAKNWITQTTSHGWNGFHHHRDAYVALQSFDNVLLKITQDDGNIFNYLIDSTGGEIRRPYEVLQPMKAKLSQYSLISCKPFRLFVKDSCINVKPWGAPVGYTSQHPFGGLHFERGARI